MQGPVRLALLKLFTKILFAKSLRLMNPGLRGGDSGWLLHSAQAQRDRAEHPRVQDEPLLPAPILLQDKSWGVPGHPNVHVGSLPRAQSTGEAMPRGEGSAATSSSQPVQVIVVIVTEERRGGGTPLHAHLLLILLF